MNTITNRMSGDEAALWTQLSTFSFDGPDTRQARPGLVRPNQTWPALTFAARLARENGWPPAYTRRVLDEYRKFLFLCCVTPSGVTPSDPVDQAWHLHLTYTHSYWVDLCRNTLGRDLHHNPTKGGAREGAKFDGMYTHSQALYEQYFGHTPPTDIWPANEQRFSDIDFERVNRRTNWIIRKPAWTRPGGLLAGLGLLGVVGLFVRANGGALLFLIASAVGLFGWLLYELGQSNFSNHDWRDDGGDAGGSGTFFSTDSSHDGHAGHGGDGHGDGGHGGDSGCSASGCSSGCSSGCGGGCGGGGD